MRLRDDTSGAIGAEALKKLEEVGQTLALIDGLEQQHSMLQQVLVRQPWTAVKRGHLGFASKSITRGGADVYENCQLVPKRVG